MSNEPHAIVRKYFGRILARDLGVVDLFHEEALLVGLGGVKSGKAAIREFYENSIHAHRLALHLSNRSDPFVR